jgi:hypothetical protein
VHMQPTARRMRTPEHDHQGKLLCVSSSR